MGKRDDIIYWRLYDFLNGDTDTSCFPEYNFEKFIKEYHISETEEITMSGYKKDWLAMLVLLSTRYWNSDPRIEDHLEDPSTGDDIPEININGQFDKDGG
jgi:hypothetical protein